MKRKMMDLSIEVNAGEIHVVQANYPNEDCVIALHPDQVELVTRWLEEAKRASGNNQAASSRDTTALLSLVTDFLGNFDVVFGNDWEFTKLNLSEVTRVTYILPSST